MKDVKKNFVNKKCQKNFLSTEMGKIIEYWIIIQLYCPLADEEIELIYKVLKTLIF